MSQNGHNFVLHVFFGTKFHTCKFLSFLMSPVRIVIQLLPRAQNQTATLLLTHWKWHQGWKLELPGGQQQTELEEVYSWQQCSQIVQRRRRSDNNHIQWHWPWKLCHYQTHCLPENTWVDRNKEAGCQYTRPKLIYWQHEYTLREAIWNGPNKLIVLFKSDHWSTSWAMITRRLMEGGWV